MSTVQRLAVQEIGDVTIVRFLDSRVTNPMEIEDLGQQLYHVLEAKNNCSKLVLDFSPVEFLSSATIGKLMSLNRKVKQSKVALRLCNLRQEIRDVFRICNLDRMFEIHEDQAEAIASFQEAG
jgi:anti-sigma B factor antagonist